MDSDIYVNLLAQYEASISSMSPEERRTYDRADYEPDQDFQLEPEYEDYLTDFSSKFQENLEIHTMRFAYQELALRNQTMLCQGHRHEFQSLPASEWKNESLQGEVIRLTSETKPPVSACWIDRIKQAVIHINHDFDHRKSLQLQKPMLTFLRILGLNFPKSHKEQNMLYRAYRALLYSRKDDDPALEQLQDAIGTSKLYALERLVELEKPRKKCTDIGRDRFLLCTAEQTLADHGFHKFILAATHHSQRYLRHINAVRRTGINYTDEEFLIRYEDTLKSIKTCKACQYNPKKVMFSTPGVYYAPPGMGKTTVQRKGGFTGFDTDWLLSMLDHEDVDIFLYHDIPIITNQYNVFENSSVMMVGFWNHEQLRKTGSGKLFTKLEEVETSQQRSTNFQLAKYEKQVFLEHRILELKMLEYLNRYTVEKFISNWRRGPYSD